MLLDKEDRTAEPDDCADDELPTAFDDCSTSVIGQSSLQSGANKRSAPPSFHHDRRPSKQMRLVSEEPAAITELLVRHCCKCGDGPWAMGMQVACPDCSHSFCQECKIEGFNTGTVYTTGG
jgi:hypothetical protein